MYALKDIDSDEVIMSSHQVINYGPDEGWMTKISSWLAKKNFF